MSQDPISAIRQLDPVGPHALDGEVPAPPPAPERLAPRRRRVWSWPLAAGLLAVAVPSAVAVAIATDTRVPIPGMDRADPSDGRTPSVLLNGQQPRLSKAQPAGPAVIVASGGRGRAGYRIAAKRCVARGRVSVAVAFFGSGTSPASFGTCAQTPARRPAFAPNTTWRDGRTWIYGVTIAEVATIDAFLVLPGDYRSRPVTRRVRVATTPFRPLAVKQGRLPEGRVFVVYRSRPRVRYTRMVARNRAGKTILACDYAECPYLNSGVLPAGR